MYRKFFVFILLTTLSAAVSLAQDAPKVKKAEKAPKKRAESLYRIAVGGSGGYLGIQLKEVSSSNYQELGLTEVRGVAIRKVLKESAAEKAGLLEGDVIVSFNGEKITSSRKFSRMVREVAPDHTVNLTVMRDGAEMQIPVTMGKRRGIAFVTSGDFVFPDMPDTVVAPDFEFPTPPRGVSPVTPPNVRVFPAPEGLEKLRTFSFFSGRRLGVGVTSITKQLGDYFGVGDGKGLLINDVSKDSPAERAGLRAGDVIVEIDGKPVKRHSDLLRGIGGDKEGDVQLTIVRDRARQTISVTPEKRDDSNFRFKFETKDDTN